MKKAKHIKNRSAFNKEWKLELPEWASDFNASTWEVNLSEWNMDFFAWEIIPIEWNK